MRQSICCFVLIAGTTSAGQISVPLVDVDPQRLNHIDANFGTLPSADDSRGWAFSLRFPAILTHLAWFDTDRDGLSHSHAIGIWQNTLESIVPNQGPFWPQVSVDQLVVQTMIPAGTSAELSGPWRRVPIGPLYLPAGQYHIVGSNQADSQDDLIFWSSRGESHGDQFIAEGARLRGMSYGQAEFGPVEPGKWIPFGIESVPAALMGPMPFVSVMVPEPSTATFAVIVLIGLWMILDGRSAAKPRAANWNGDDRSTGDSSHTSGERLE
jgi:hypothetical protein